MALGGELSLESSFELRFAGSWWGTQWVTFLDGAEVTTGIAEFQSLHWAAGAGARWGTPLGVLRLDIGRRLNRANELNEGRWAWHIAMGEAF